MFRITSIVFLTAIYVASPVRAEDRPRTSLPEPVARALKSAGFSTRGLSIYVHEVGQERPLLTVAADTPRNPASTIKLLATLVALEELGPAYTWRTEAYAGGPVRDGKLEGDFYLKGYGDPYLVIERFWHFLRTLRNGGLNEIAGDLVLDQSYFAKEAADPADFDGRPLRAYNVLPQALLVNFQAVNFKFLPEAGRVRIIADPLPAHMEIVNRVKLKYNRCRGWARRLKMRLRNAGQQQQVIFSGRYNAACGKNEIFRVVSEPAPYIHGVFRTLWTEQGAWFNGGVREGTVPFDAELLHTGYSLPLADIVRAINKYSNNVMTRQLLLTLGAERLAPPGTTDKGIRVVRAWLDRHGLNFPELVLDNGAGLSRKERISARHLGELLLAAHESPYMPEFMSSLPVFAVDGTLRKRFGGELAGRVHLKTGTIDNVRAMAGYLLDRRGRRMVVVSLHNRWRADSRAGEMVQDALLNWVYQRP